MTNIELTLEQLQTISGGGKADREARKEARKAKRDQRKHDRKCDDGPPASDCPYGPDSESGVDHHEQDTHPGCGPWGPCI
ncbi:hypothetical [Prochlorococcus marinus str. MIT 9313]|uniref:Uncharacterized protein n=1 Tax=Prochlorococcus marinus (strain MIT 9313) TaxID=74547 RepID=Q7V720_PROMM|nr:CCRG-2 family protein [Prochlorococcus marinus]CAE21118.1 hypothetical [Prochlorococcus marinus str. MIT 9313]